MSQEITIEDAKKKMNEIIKQMKDELSEKDWAVDKVIDVLGLKIDDRKASKKDLYIALNRRLRRMSEEFEADFLSFVGNEENFKTENLEANKELLLGMKCKMINIFFVRNMIRSWFAGADNQVEFSAKLARLVEWQRMSKSNIDFLLESVDNKGEIIYKNFGIYDPVGFNGIDGYIPGYFEENGEYQEGYFKIYIQVFGQFVKIYERELNKFRAPLVGNVNFSSCIPGFKMSDEAKKQKENVILSVEKNQEKTKKDLEEAEKGNDVRKENSAKEALEKAKASYRNIQSEREDGFGFGCYLNALMSLIAQQPIWYLCFLKLANQIFEPNTFDPVPKSDVMLHTLKSEHETLNHICPILVAILDYIKALDDAKQKNCAYISPLYLKRQFGERRALFSPRCAADVRDLLLDLGDQMKTDLTCNKLCDIAEEKDEAVEFLRKSLNDDPEWNHTSSLLLEGYIFNGWLDSFFTDSSYIDSFYWRPGYKKLNIACVDGLYLEAHLNRLALKQNNLSSLRDIVRYNKISGGNQYFSHISKKVEDCFNWFSCPPSSIHATNLKLIRSNQFLLLERGRGKIFKNSITLPSLIKIGNEYNDYLMLSGVVVHSGNSSASGHYYSIIRDEKNVFYKISDESVRKINNLVLEEDDALKKGSRIVLYKRINRNIFDFEVKHGAKYEDFSTELIFDPEKWFTPLYLHGSVEKLKEVMHSSKLIDKTGNLINDTNSNAINSEQANINIVKDTEITIFKADSANNIKNEDEYVGFVDSENTVNFDQKTEIKKPDPNFEADSDNNIKNEDEYVRYVRFVDSENTVNFDQKTEIKKPDPNENLKLDVVIGSCSSFDEFFKTMKGKNDSSNIVQVLNSKYEKISFIGKVIAFFSALLFCIRHRDFSNFMICVKLKAVFALSEKGNVKIYTQGTSGGHDLSNSIKNMRERVYDNENIKSENNPKKHRGGIC